MKSQTTFYRKPYTVEAFQWTGDESFINMVKRTLMWVRVNVEVDCPLRPDWNSACIVIPDRPQLEIQLCYSHSHSMMNECNVLRCGDWLVFEDTEPRIVTRDEFKELYFLVNIVTETKMPTLESLL